MASPPSLNRMAREPIGATPRIIAFDSVLGPIRISSRRDDSRPDDWDALAMATGASHEGSAVNLHALSFKNLGRGTVRWFAVHTTEGRRIGQCAILVRGRRFEVIDGLRLLPEYQPLWRDVMTRIVQACGPGDYRYGSRWNSEPPRIAAIAGIPGVVGLAERPLVVQAIPFADWPDFESYWRKTSENVRRNARYAIERHGYGSAVRDWKFAAARAATLARLQRDSLTPKGIDVPWSVQVGRLLSKAMWQRERLHCWVARDSGGALIAFLDVIEFGDNFEYVLGGQRQGVDGAQWLLLREAIAAAFQARPNGRFVMGSFEEAVHDESTGGGLLRARRSLRVTDYPTSIVSFSYL